VCMDPGDYAALAAAGHAQGEHTFKVQYEDCTAEVLDLVSMAKIGCPCTELCTMQQDCGRAAPARHHRREWVLAKHDTEANKQLLLAMDSEAPKNGKKIATRKRKARAKGRPTAGAAPEETAVPANGSGSDSDEDMTFAEMLENERQLNTKIPRLLGNKQTK
jgi:hypothetical protein